MNKWDSRYLGLAGYVAQWSKDPSTRVGAVIVDDKQRVISVGFNGLPRGVEDTYLSRETKLAQTIHAEENALAFAKRDVEGMAIYVSHPPCARCAAKLIQAGIKRVVCKHAEGDFQTRWADDLDLAGKMYQQAGVTFEEM